MPAVISPVGGTRIEPTDGYTFVKGTTAIFKAVFMNEGRATKVDTGTDPSARILQPKFLNGGQPSPIVIATLIGSLVSGQEYEYQFSWDIPSDTVPLDEYVIAYDGTLGSIDLNFGDEFFTVLGSPGQISLDLPSYATVNDVRMKKFNIDDYLPPSTRDDVTGRDRIIRYHLRDATIKLREELNLFKARGNSENFRLFCSYYAIWSILLAARGEDGSGVSDQNLIFWRKEWSRILAQEKRESVFQSIPCGRG